MKILKRGNEKPRKFICPNCDCEFVAGTREYWRTERFDDIYYKCDCPECNYTSDISEPWEDDYDGPGCILI